MAEDTVDSPRSSGYATGRATKQSIVESAAEAFAVTGFHGTSLRAIAREAGVDHSTLLHHFGNKTALLLAVIEWHDKRSMPQELPGEITVEFVADAIVDTARRNEDAPGLMQLLSLLSAEAATDGHPARESMQQRHELLKTLIAFTIRRQASEGDAPVDPMDPDERAALIIATWDGMQLYNGLHPGELDIPGHVRAMLREAFRLDQ
ncbi:TetR/AcrR family transcriptional regulator [Demequina flava]|uniref:TetR/AcrR family transcriptional regulator n=1 Tax=Demequina flava TaxID=1095025 RepID=UPI000781A601|nr:TetR/AcrR family transcriptional regulator [Demequina flava]